MQPSAYPIRRDVLKQFWHTYMKTGAVAPANGAEPDPIVVRSWQRCRPRSDPRQHPRPTIAQETTLQATLRTHRELIGLARPFLEDIYQFMEGAYCTIVLADGAGCILDVEGDRSQASASHGQHTTRGRLSGVASSMGGLQALGLQLGAFWSEGNLGTNALGLALITAMPVQVVGAEHYYEVYHHLATSAAPIHDVNGRIIGLLGLVEPATAVARQTLSLVMAAARAISNQMQAHMYLQEANHRLGEVHTVLEAINEGVVSWDAEGRINHINPQAGRMLGINPQRATGARYQSVLTLPAPLDHALSQAQEVQDLEVSFDVRGQPVQIMVGLRVVGNGDSQPAGYILMLRPIDQVRQLVHQQVGTKASLLLEDISSYSVAMRPLLRQARTAARGTAPVLLRGEGGVGKNHLARAIHSDGLRADQPFMALNCRAIPHELMIGEFLGHEQDGRPSKFELAHRGTLLFDQIEALSLEMQATLLHIIETGHVMRLGSTRPIPVDVRIVAATTANLEQLVADGNFISHLYYRFGVFNFEIPPLRQRTDDIPLLAERFLARITTRSQQDVWIDDEAMRVMRRYPWPGNVRELESALERALLQSHNNVITVADLPESVRQGRVMTDHRPSAQPVLTAAEAEREAILRAGWACQGRVTEMARQLGIGRTTLWRKMKRYHLSPDNFKN